MSYTPPRAGVIHCWGMSVNPALIIRALVMADLTWGVPIAMIVALQNMSLQNATTVETEKPVETELFSNRFPVTMLGIPVQIDDELPPSVIELRHNGMRIMTLDQLAIPWGFDEN